MTDRNPDDLYDALRDRLADYGQEPPAALWAGIRAQLPPPVAAPQRRRRRRAPVAWLFLITLSLVAVGAAWHWGTKPSAAPAISKAGRTAFPVSPPNADSNNNSTQRATAANHAPLPARGENQPPAAQASAATAQPAPSGAAAEALEPSVTAPAASTRLIATTGSHPAGAPATGTAGTSAGAAGANSAKTAETAGTGAGAAVATSANTAGASAAALVASRITAGRRAGRMAGPKELAATSDLKRTSSTRAMRGQTQKLGNRQARTVAGAHGQWPEYGNPTMGVAGRARPGRNAVTGASSRLSQALAASKNPLAWHRHQPATATALATATKPATGQPLPATATLPIKEQPTTQPALTTAPIGSSPLLASDPHPQRTAPLPILVVAMPQAAWPGLPTPQPVAVVPGPLTRPFASRWAVQVVAGPALTYRYLDTSAGAAAPTSPPFVYTAAFTPVAPLERPALGSAAQATVRRTFGGHWSLSGGLGYAEYASALALQQVRSAAVGVTAASFRSDSAATTTGIHRRDTYRFVTVPVRVGYGWTLSGRWRVGLLAGAEAAVYVGGSSTEGSPCACQSQSWGFSGSPYRRLSVGASLGAEVRYRLGEGGRWELLAQPTATYLLSPLANYTPYYQRHLFGGAALLGVAFNLP